MELTTSKKKIMLATIFTSGLALAISQAALAAPAAPTAAPQAGVQGQGMKGRGAPMDPVAEKAREKFLNETVAIRKELAEKNTVLRALLNAGTPDTAKASQLAGELFELREKLRLKAQETGLPLPMLMMGEMHGQGMGMGMGMGMGGGRHHMM